MKSGRMRLLPFFLFISTMLQASDFSLAGFDLVSVGFVPEDEDTPIVVTEGSVSARYIPADWINFRAGLSCELPDTVDFFNTLPDRGTDGTLSFDNASINFRPALSIPVGITAFTGKFDDPSADTLLREYLKETIDAPEFHELPAGAAFSCESEINGTGVLLAAVPGNANAVTGLYAYWNGEADADAIYTGDARIAIACDLVRLNAFAGLSWQPSETEASFRGALTAIFSAEAGYELYVSVGIRNARSLGSRIDRDLYLIFEPRLRWEKADLALSFFSSPAFPENSLSDPNVESESNYLGANILAGFGNLDTQGMRGGISLLGSINPEDPGTVTPFSFSVTPFYSMMISDFQLTVSTAIKPLLMDEIDTAMEICISMKAVY